MNCECCGERLPLPPIVDLSRPALCDLCASLFYEAPEEDADE